jgi:hypothetical protein
MNIKPSGCVKPGNFALLSWRKEVVNAHSSGGGLTTNKKKSI